MAATARLLHLELTDDDGAGPVEGVAVILAGDDAISQAAKDAGAGEAKRRIRVVLGRAAWNALKDALRRPDSDPVLDALPTVIQSQ